MVALGVEEAGDRLVGGAREGVLQVELVLVAVDVLVLPRHVHGVRTRKGQEHAKKRRLWLYGGEETTIAACYAVC